MTKGNENQVASCSTGGRGEEKRKTEIWSPYEPDAGKITGKCKQDSRRPPRGKYVNCQKLLCEPILSQISSRNGHATATKFLQIERFSSKYSKQVSSVREYPARHKINENVNALCTVLI